MFLSNENDENKPRKGYIEFLDSGPVKGCSCSAGCLQIIVLLIMLALLTYLLFFR